MKLADVPIEAEPVAFTQLPGQPRRTTTLPVALMAAVDLIVLVVSGLLAWLFRFGSGSQDRLNGAVDYGHLGVAVILALVWWMLLGAYGTRPRDSGVSWGVESGRLAKATFAAFGAVGIVSVFFTINISRSFLLVAFATGFAALLIGRRIARIRTAAFHRRGERLSLVLVVGSARSARRIARWFHSYPTGGYRVVGAHLPDDPQDNDSLLWQTSEDRWAAIPVFGSTRTIAEALTTTGADTVIVSDSEQLGPDRLNDLTWELASRGVTLLVSPNVAGVATPRLQLREVSGMPFVLVDEPTYAASNRWPKAVFDRVGALAMLILLSPVMALAALAIWLVDRGPILDRSMLIGLGGRPFTMLRFRTLPVGVARGVTADLNGPQMISGDGPLPTRVGRWLIRYGLDATPQLFLVLSGRMSIVGPRPLRAEHLAEQPERMARRLLVKQGLTGLWQVSGRSTMSWEEAARLDIEYVENWSIRRDLVVVWRTLRAIVTRARLTREVAKVQAEIDLAAPWSKAQLTVDARGGIFLNDYPLFGGDTTALLAEIDTLLARREPALVVTVNVDQILDLEREENTVEVYQGADLLVMDGMPVVQLARMLGAGEVHRHTGADLLPLMAAESAERGWRVSILGGAAGVAQTAAEQLRSSYPGSQVSSVEFPMMHEVTDPASHAVVAQLRAQEPDLVFVCLGAPKQELWVLAWRDALPPAVYVGAGAAVDFAAQKVSRAPKWLQRIGGEWLWRLGQEPGRLVWRYLVKGPRFIRVVARSLKVRP